MTEHEATNLRRLLAESGLTIEELAERTGLDRRTIMGVADGNSSPHSRTIGRLAKGLGVSANEFFLDPNRLAQLNVAGGSIRNIAMNAAFIAVDQDEPVRMRHLARATRIEYAKLDTPLTESEVREWE